MIFDDLKRYARDVEFHLKLRRLMAERNAIRECLNFNFEDSPEGKFNEIISAAAGELERLQMGRQNRQKSIARIEQGYWVFRAPKGYKYAKSARGGKELVLDEILAPIVREALEGYAFGRFASQTEVRRFLEAQPAYPKDMPNGGIRPQTIVRLLGKIVYAGFVEAPNWGITPRQGNHPPIISFATYQKIQTRLNASSPAVLSAYEKKIEKLEHEKLLLQEKLQNPGKSRHSYSELFELSMRFLSSPCKVWQSGRLDLQKIVLRLAFSEPFQYCRERGFLNTNFSMPFNILGGQNMAILQNGAAGEN